MRSGGRYRTGKSGKTVLAEAPTQDHPRGNMARSQEAADRPTRQVESPVKKAKAKE
jgi:hypothetical protein